MTILKLSMDKITLTGKEVSEVDLWRNVYLVDVRDKNGKFVGTWELDSLNDFLDCRNHPDLIMEYGTQITCGLSHK